MKRIFALVLAVIMALTATGLTVFAADGSVMQTAATNPVTGHVRGGKITFGSYPQSKVTNAALIAELDKISKEWVSYYYCYKSDDASDGPIQYSDYMQYCDVSYGGAKYRAVYFAKYRPCKTSNLPTELYSVQDENGYKVDTVYYFKYEPLQWTILDTEEGYVLCDKVIDSQAYNSYIYNKAGDYYGDADGSYRPSNWSRCTLRDWLNSSFYETAFSATEQEQIGLSQLENVSTYVSETGDNYDTPITYDKVFIPSSWDVTDSSYGFGGESDLYNYTRIAKGSTDYAKCQGYGKNPNIEDILETRAPSWRLRTCDGASTVWYVGALGKVYNFYNTDSTSYGIRPAIKFTPLPIRRKVTFNANGGTVGEQFRKVEHGKEIGELPVPTREGYTFDGWYSGYDLTEGVVAGYKIRPDSPITRDMVVYAKWIANPVELNLVKAPEKKYYELNETFDITGAELTIKYADGTSVPADLSKLTVKGFDSSKQGTNNVYLSYTENGVTVKSATFKVIIDKQVSEIEITSQFGNTTYYVGDELDKTGLSVLAKYTDGTNTDVTNEVTITGFDSSSEGAKKMTVSYTYKEKTLSLQVNYTVLPAVTKLKVEKAPDKTEYAIGDSFEKDGMVIKAVMSNGNEVDVTGDVTLSGFDSAAAGTKQITVSYVSNGKTYTVQFDYYVIPETNELKVEKLPTKTEYIVGETFLKDGMVVKLLKEDGTSTDVTSSVRITGFDSTNTGDVTVTVSYDYEEKTYTDEFTVKIVPEPVVNVLSLTVTKNPTKTTYLKGDTNFDPAGMKVVAALSNGTTKDVTNDVTISGFDTSSVGAKEVTLSYSHGETTATAKVSYTVVTYVVGISLESKPNKTTYLMGETFEKDGMKVVAEYTDGSKQDVTNDVTISGFDSSALGTREITLKYTTSGKTFQVKFNYTVKAYLVSVKVETLPAKREYIRGESFSKDGMVVIATFSDGSRVDVTNEVIISGFSTSSTGEKTIGVGYTADGVSGYDTFTVNVISFSTRMSQNLAQIPAASPFRVIRAFFKTVRQFTSAK